MSVTLLFLNTSADNPPPILLAIVPAGTVSFAKARLDWQAAKKEVEGQLSRLRQSILQALAEQARIVRLPLNKVGLTNRIQKAADSSAAFFILTAVLPLQRQICRHQFSRPPPTGRR